MVFSAFTRQGSQVQSLYRPSIRVPGCGRSRLFLGLTSYALYVLHSPLSAVLYSLMRHDARLTQALSGSVFFGVAIVAALLLTCWLVDRYFDSPVRRRLN
jgi:peptidoglycan/LPS O-acetylase OafA/YrhL